jgi:hypothetical protein
LLKVDNTCLPLPGYGDGETTGDGTGILYGRLYGTGGYDASNVLGYIAGNGDLIGDGEGGGYLWDGSASKHIDPDNPFPAFPSLSEMIDAVKTGENDESIDA